MNPIPNLPNIEPALLDLPTPGKLAPSDEGAHPPRILAHFGADVKIFDPTALPMVGSVPDTHPKVVELRALCLWSEGHDAGVRWIAIVQRDGRTVQAHVAAARARTAIDGQIDKL
jgi:hypothetical protein